MDHEASLVQSRRGLDKWTGILFNSADLFFVPNGQFPHVRLHNQKRTCLVDKPMTKSRFFDAAVEKGAPGSCHVTVLGDLYFDNKETLELQQKRNGPTVMGKKNDHTDRNPRLIMATFVFFFLLFSRISLDNTRQMSASKVKHVLLETLFKRSIAVEHVFLKTS